MSHLCHVILLLLLLPSGARRSSRVDLADHVSQEQNNTLANGVGVSGESGEAWFGHNRGPARAPYPRPAHRQLPSLPGGSSPLAKVATAAIDLNNFRSQRRGVTMMAGARQAELSKVETLRKALTGVDDDTQQKLMDVMEQVDESIVAGITEPLGFFDPVGFATDATPGKLLFYREVELKHGRVGMLAALGFLVGEQFHPLFGGDIDVPSYMAFQQTPLETFWPAVVFAIAIPEIYSVFTFQNAGETADEPGETWAMRLDHTPGDIGFDPLGLKPEDPKELTEIQNKELNNGRLGMIAAAGMIAQEIASGEKLF